MHHTPPIKPAASLTLDRRHHHRIVLVLIGAVLGAIGSSLVVAQTATPPANSAEEAIRLNVFEVREDSDTSYGALQSNSLTAFRLDLAKTPATAQIFTQTFMDDIAATSIEEVLTGYAGTVTANTGNVNAMLDMPGDRDGQQG